MRSTRFSGSPTLAWLCFRTSGMADPGLGAPQKGGPGLLGSGSRGARAESGDAAGHPPQAHRADVGQPGKERRRCLEADGDGVVGGGGDGVVRRPPPSPGIGTGQARSRPPEDRSQCGHPSGLDGRYAATQARARFRTLSKFGGRIVEIGGGGVGGLMDLCQQDVERTLRRSMNSSGEERMRKKLMLMTVCFMITVFGGLVFARDAIAWDRCDDPPMSSCECCWFQQQGYWGVCTWACNGKSCEDLPPEAECTEGACPHSQFGMGNGRGSWLRGGSWAEAAS